MDKKVIPAILMGLLLVGGAVAGWVFTFSKTSGVNVASEKPLVLTDNFATEECNALESSCEYVHTLSIEGKSTNEVLATYVPNITVTDLETEGCTFDSNDYAIGISPEDNQTIYGKEIKEVNITYGIQEWSCPATISVQLPVIFEKV